MKEIRKIDLDELKSLLLILKHTKIPFTGVVHSGSLSAQHVSVTRTGNSGSFILCSSSGTIFIEIDYDGKHIITTKYFSHLTDIIALIKDILEITLKKIILCEKCKHAVQCVYHPRCNSLGYCDKITMQ